MKLIFKKLIFGGHHILVLPRVEFAPEDTIAMANVTVDLGRTAKGKCVFPLGALSAHDDHAPPFLPDGSSPPESTDPTLTADAYVARIVAALKAAGLEFAVEMTEETIELPQMMIGGDNEEEIGEPDVSGGWTKYLPENPDKKDPDVH